MRQYPYRINQPARKPAGRRKFYFMFSLLLVLVAVGVFGLIHKSGDANTIAVMMEPGETAAMPKQEELANQELERKRQLSPLTQLTLPTTGQSAIGTLELGAIATTPSDQQVPIASITKVITSLVILEKQPLQLGEQGKTIELTAQDEQYYWDYVALQGTITPVTAGFTMSQYEVLQAMLLASSNNMADTIVDNYFKSKEEYVAYANDYLARMGLENTQVADTTGFSPESKSTPSDLIKLGQIALNNPVVKQIVAQPDATISVAGSIPNYNPLIADPNVIGLKPGATDEAGYTLLFAAELATSDGGTETFIGVTLGFQDRPEYVQTARNMIEEARSLLL